MALQELKDLVKTLTELTGAASVNEAALLSCIQSMSKITGVTKDMLATTSAPKIVKSAIKMSSEPETVALGKKCVGVWKEAVLKELGADASQVTPTATPTPTPLTGGRNAVEIVKKTPETEKVSVVPDVPPPITPNTGDVMRDRGVQMLYKIFWPYTSPTDGSLSAADAATFVEAEIFTIAGSANGMSEYKRKLTSSTAALKKNVELAGGIMAGVMHPKQFAALKPHEMASKQVAEERGKIHESYMASRNTEKAQPVATTDFFKCGKCKQRKCSFYQLQTRSADEPMTTFVTCVNCGNRWKFS